MPQLPSDSTSQTAAEPISVASAYELGDTDFDERLDLPSQQSSPTVPATPQAAETPAPATAPAAPKHSARLVRLANEAGLSEQQIRETPTEALEEHVYGLAQQAIQHARSLSREDTRRAAAEPQRPAAATPATTPETPAVAAEDDYDLGDMSDFDPKLVAAIKKIGKESRDKIKGLEATVAGYQQREMQRESETLSQTLDRLFETTDAGRFGKGRFREMKEDQPEYNRRLAVAGMMDKITSGSLEDKFRQAVSIIYGDTPAAPPTPVDPLAARRESYRNGTVARPTQRTPTDDTPKGERKALATAANYMKEHGIGDSDEMTEDGFLD